MLRGEELVRSFGAVRAVDGVTLEVRPGEIVGLLGPNGAGKTTTFSMLVGLDRPDAGRVFFEGEEITSLPLYERARRGIGYLPQEPSVFRGLTARENLVAVLELRGAPRAEAHRRADAMLEEMGLSHRADLDAARLSGGERRRCEIARALVLEPRVLLLDEPFAGIDPKQVEELRRVLSELRARRGVGILVTDHNVRDTLALVDRGYILHEGRILCEGDAAHLAAHPDARRFYLGDSFEMVRA